jgi:outer membrane protein assembly factor BamB
MNTFNKLILTTSLTLAAGTASAAQLLALGADGMLHKVDTDTLSVSASMAVEGASDLRGIDVRPANGTLYALSGATQLYTLDMATGKATAGAQLQMELPGDKHAVVDFNPVADRLRLLAADGTNFRVNVETGEVAVDGTVAYASDFASMDMMEKVVAGAYTNSFAGTEKTELYTVDLSSGMLMLQNPPNDGVQQPVGELAKGLDAAAMDIVSDGMGGNTAYVLTGKTLHTVDLKTGAPTPLGDVEGLPEGIIDIAVLPAM